MQRPKSKSEPPPLISAWLTNLCNTEQYVVSNEDMTLALAGQFKQLSHEPEKFR